MVEDYLQLWRPAPSTSTEFDLGRSDASVVKVGLEGPGVRIHSGGDRVEKKTIQSASASERAAKRNLLICSPGQG